VIQKLGKDLGGGLTVDRAPVCYPKDLAPSFLTLIMAEGPRLRKRRKEESRNKVVVESGGTSNSEWAATGAAKGALICLVVFTGIALASWGYIIPDDSTTRALLSSPEYLNATQCDGDGEESGLDCFAPNDTFADCLLEGKDIFRQCRNRTCVLQKHMNLLHGDCIPRRCRHRDASFSSSPPPWGDIGNEGLSENKANSTPPAIIDLEDGPIPEYRCDSSQESELQAVKLVIQGILRSRPMVFRNCTKRVPAIKKWTKRYLKNGNYLAFSQLFSSHKHSDAGLYPVPKGLEADLFSAPGESIFVDFLKAYRKKNWVWTSQGGRHARTHFDNFDNVHVVIKERKHFWLASPRYAPNMYIDFVADDCPGRAGLVDIGCDDFGCYNFLPFHDEDLHFSRYPKLKQVKMLHTFLQPGDSLLIPAFWIHHVRHLPLKDKDKDKKRKKKKRRKKKKQKRAINVAVAFLHQRQDKPKSRFASDIYKFWRKHDEGKVTKDDFSCTNSDASSCPWISKNEELRGSLED